MRIYRTKCEFETLACVTYNTEIVILTDPTACPGSGKSDPTPCPGSGKSDPTPCPGSGKSDPTPCTDSGKSDPTVIVQ